MNDEGEKDLELTAQLEGLFKKLGLTLYQSSGDLKNTYDILKDLSEIYPTLTAAEKAYVTETIAGKFQSQNAAAILNNFSTAVSATETALNSTGSAARENEKVLDSIEGKINAFNSAFSQLAQSVIGSDLVKTIVDLGTALLKLADNGLVKLLSKTVAITAALGLGMAIFKKVSGTIKTTYTSIKTYTTLSKAAKNETSALITEEQAKILTDGKAALAQLKLNMAITAAVLAYQLISNAIENAKEKQKKMIEDVIDNASVLTDSIKDIDEEIKNVQKLRTTLDDSSSSYKDAAQARQELQEIQKRLIDNYGIEKSQIDLVNGSIDDQIQKLKDLKQQEAQNYLNENRTGYNKAKENIYEKGFLKDLFTQDFERGIAANLTNSSGSLSSEIENILLKYGEINQGNGEFVGAYWNWDVSNIDKAKQGLTEVQKYLLENEKTLIESGEYTREKFDDVLGYVQTELKDIEEDYGDSYKALEEYQKMMLNAARYDEFVDKLKELASTTSLNKENVQELIKQYPSLDEALKVNNISVEDIIKDYQDIGVTFNDIISKQGNDLLNFLKDLVLNNTYTQEEIEELTEKFPEFADAIDKSDLSLERLITYLKQFYETAGDTSNIVKDFSTDAQSLEDAYTKLNSAVSEFNEQGFLSADTLNTLVTTMVTLADGTKESLLSYITFTEDGIKANTSALYSNLDALKEAAIADIKASTAKQILQVVAQDETKAINDSKTAVENSTSTIENSLDADADKIASNIGLATSYEALKNAASGKGLDVSGWDAQQKQIESILKNGQNMISRVLNTNFKKTTTTKGSSSKSATSEISKEFTSLKNQFKYNQLTIDEYIAALEKLLGKVKKGSDEWNQIDEEIRKQKLSKIDDAYKRGTLSLDDYIKKLKELLKTYKEGTEGWNDLADKIKSALQTKADDQAKDYSTAEGAAIGLIDEEIEKLEKLKEEQEEYYDKLIDDKEKANDETERELELARLEEALANAKNEKIKRVKGMLSIKIAQNGETPEEDNTVGKICFEI